MAIRPRLPIVYRDRRWQTTRSVGVPDEIGGEAIPERRLTSGKPLTFSNHSDGISRNWAAASTSEAIMRAEVITERDDLVIRRLVLEPGEDMPWHTDACHRFSVVRSRRATAVRILRHR
jgi:hypothetical protein